MTDLNEKLWYHLGQTCHCHYKTRSGQFDPRRIQVLYGNLFAIKVLTNHHQIQWFCFISSRKSCWQRRYWLHILQPSVKEIRINLFYYFYNLSACFYVLLAHFESFGKSENGKWWHLCHKMATVWDLPILKVHLLKTSHNL